MRFKNYYVPTLKEDPADAEVISHKLLVRAGLIRKLTSGIYSFLPLGLRTLKKITQIVREEMDRAGCLEVMLPVVQPAELWQESGRWDFYGKELLRFKDRNMRDFCLGPTHEEVITDLIRHEIRSYRQLPINLYQIHTKFRDEIRPRFGLMRCREFIMKDGYSFDRDDEGAEKSYFEMYNAYKRIFQRIGLRFRAVEADTGQIGGSFSHEFMVLADTGEDTIVVCTSCEFASNIEKAEVKIKLNEKESLEVVPEIEEVFTPNKHTVDEVAEFLNVDKSKIIKTLLYIIENEPVAFLIPGTRELNEAKVKSALGVVELRMATHEEVKEWSGCEVGFAGPLKLKVKRIYADNTLLHKKDLVCGANKKDYHLIHVDMDRDVKVDSYLDLVNIEETDPCPRCGGKLKFLKGIEVGHVFKLGTKYSKAMNATFIDEDGKEKYMVMGCYGIGVSRIIAAAIEQNHDENGIIFPPSIAPFEIIILTLDLKDSKVLETSESLYKFLLNKNIDVIWDNRDLRAGFKFKDADLIGFPIQIIVGKKGVAQGIVEIKNRKTNEKLNISISEFKEKFEQIRQNIWKEWGIL